MDKAQRKRQRRQRARLRVRRSIAGSAGRPRLAVFKSSRYVYAQIIDDDRGETLVQANSREAEIRGKIEAGTNTKAAARRVGEVVGERAKQQGIESVVFDRSGYRYHGRIKEVAEGARAKGLQF